MKRLLIILSVLTIFISTAHAGIGVWKTTPNSRGGYDTSFCKFCWEPDFLPKSNNY